MNTSNEDKTRRILIIDDNPDIHQDFQRILLPQAEMSSEGLDDLEAKLFGDTEEVVEPAIQFQLASAMQGEEACSMVKAAVSQNNRYALAFIDMRMPPGWDGLETIRHLWQVDPKLEVVICTAYSDYSLAEIFSEVGASDQLLVLKKPFEPIEVIQLATALTEKWNLARQAEMEFQDMERIVEEQTHELYAASEYIRLLATEAKAANELKSSFLANMSHGIRTPLNDVIGLSSMLAETPLDQEQQEYVRIVRKSGMALLGLIDDILDLSKIEAGEIEFEESEFNLRDTIEEALDVVALKAYEKGLEVIGIVNPDVPQLVISDPGRIRQILINLANNAIKFTECGEVTIEVRLVDERINLDHYGLAMELAAFRNSTPSGRTLIQFSVTDTGIGIAPDAQTTLFEAFTQADASTTRKHGGTGLGLSITRHLAKVMRGSVGLLSEVGVGSEFWVTAQMVLPNRSELSNFEALPMAERDLITGSRILIVEQNARVRSFYDMQLSEWGCRFQIVDDPKTACGLLDLAAAAGDGFVIAVIDGKLTGNAAGDLYNPIISNTALATLKVIETHPIDEMSESRDTAAALKRIILGKPVKGSTLLNSLLKTLKDDSYQASKKTALFDTSYASELTILVAEDNRTNQKVIAGMLSQLSCKVEIVANGSEAVNLISGGKVDLILMDIDMPVMDGYAATRAIRNLEYETVAGYEPSHLPIIAMTDNAVIGSRERCIAAGMDDYLAKPISMAILTDKLIKWGKPMITAPASLTAGAVIVAGVDDLIDLDGLHERLGGDRKLVASVLRAFIADADALLTLLRDPCPERTMAQHQRLLSQLHSGATTISAGRLRNAVGKCATAGKPAATLAFESAFAAVEREYASVHAKARKLAYTA